MSVRRPFKLKGRSGYYIDINRKRRALGTEDYAEALRLWNEIRRRVAVANSTPDPEATGKPGSLTLGEFVAKYNAWAEQIRPKATARSEQYALGKLVALAGEQRLLRELTAEHLDALMAEGRRAGLMASSVNHLARHLKAIFSKAEVWGMVETNPFRKNKLIPVDKTPPPRIPAAEFTKLLEAITDPKANLLVRAYLATGRRRGELVNLEWKDVDIPARRYYIRKAKDHLSRWYPISDAFLAVLEGIKGERVGRVLGIQHESTATHKVKEALRAAGYGHLHLHSLRHSFGSAYIGSGGDVRTAMELLGHRQLSTTLIYTNPSEDHMAREINRITLPAAPSDETKP